MAHTLESFIDKLRTDGVEAGRQAAEEIRREAEQQAAQRVRQAEAEAARIVAAAEAEREQTVARTRTELKLAARDTVSRLREALGQAVTNVLSRAVGQKLAEPDFLEDLIKDVASQYAQADAAGDEVITVNVSESMRKRLTDWAIGTFHKPGDKKGLSLELRGALAGAGFEYSVSGGTVEITPESVVQALSEIVTPELRKLVSAAMDRGAGGASSP